MAYIYVLHVTSSFINVLVAPTTIDKRDTLMHSWLAIMYASNSLSLAGKSLRYATHHSLAAVCDYVVTCATCVECPCMPGKTVHS